MGVYSYTQDEITENLKVIIVKEVITMQIVVDKNRCPQNHSCPAVRVCPVGAIKQNRFDLPEIDQEKCTKCKKCVMYCPMGAIQEK